MICCFLYLFLHLFLSILYLLLYLLFLFSLYTHSFFFSIISFLYIFFRIHIPDIFYRNFIDVNSLITVICVILYKHLWCKWCHVLNYICGWMLKCICDCVLKCMLKFFTLTYTKHNNNKKHKTEEWLWNIQQRAYAHVQLNSM